MCFCGYFCPSHQGKPHRQFLFCFSCVKITGSVGSTVLTVKLFAKTNIPIESCLFGSPGCERPLLGQWPIFMGLKSPWGCVGMARSILTPVNRCSCGGLLAFAASSHILNLVSGGGSSVLRYFLSLTQKLRPKILNILNSNRDFCQKLVRGGGLCWLGWHAELRYLQCILISMS